MRDRGRGGVPDGDSLVLEEIIPALGLEIGLVDDHRHAVRERGEHAVRRASDPSGIRRAPEDVLGMQIEREASRHVVHHDRLVHVQGPFRGACRSAGEVEQRRVLRERRPDLVHRRGGAEEVCPRYRASRGLGVALFRHDDDVSEARQLVAEPRDLLCLELRRRDEDAPVAEPKARRDGLGPESREQRTEHRSMAERAQRRDEQLGDPAGQREHALSRLHAQGRQGIGEASCLGIELAVGDVATASRLPIQRRATLSRRGPVRGARLPRGRC